MLYITFPRLIYFILGNLYLFTTFTHLARLSFLASGGHQSVLSMFFSSSFRFCIQVRSYSIYLSYFTQNKHSRSIHVATNGMIIFFLWLNNILLYMCVYRYIHIGTANVWDLSSLTRDWTQVTAVKAWKHWVLTTGPPGNSLHCICFLYLCIHLWTFRWFLYLGHCK